MDFSPPETTAWELFLPSSAQSRVTFYGYKDMLLALQSHCEYGLYLLFHLIFLTLK